MQLQSHLILRLQRSAEDVESSVTLNGPDIGPKLDQRYASSFAAGEGEPQGPPHRDVLFTLRDGLAASRQNLVSLDNDHVENLRRFLETRSQRDELVDGVYDQLSASRRTIEDLFKPKSAFVLAAMEGPTSKNSDTLIKQANISISRLKSPEMALPASRVQAIQVDPTGLADELEAGVEELRDKNTELRQARRVVQKSRQRKNEAIKEHEQTFLWTSRTLEGYYQLAGEAELAKQIRPATRRPGRRAIEVGADESGDGSQEASSGEPSEAQASDGVAASDTLATVTPAADIPAAGTPVADAEPPADATPASDTPES